MLIGHTGDTDSLDYIEELLSHGPYIGMDRYGLDLILPVASGATRPWSSSRGAATPSA